MQTCTTRSLLTASLLLLTCAAAAAPPKLSRATPEDVGMSPAKLAEIDSLVEEGLAQQRMPGCVVLVARQGKIVLLKAYGQKALKPEPRPMTTDTVFDMASITKPVATATSVMLLIEQGKLGLDDTAANHWPEFGKHGKERITIRQLLTHQGGLIADNSLADYQDGPEWAMERICELELKSEPGTKFTYSDVSMIVLAELVRRISGQDVHAFSQQHVFAPLGMK